MNLTVNGEAYNHRGSGTVTALIEEMGAAPERVAVMVGDRVVRAGERDAFTLTEGDRVEILVLAAGG